jgi:hypothetical protein
MIIPVRIDIGDIGVWLDLNKFDIDNVLNI